MRVFRYSITYPMWLFFGARRLLAFSDLDV